MPFFIARRASLVLAFACATLSISAQAQDTTRAEEIAQCRPGEIARWGDGQDRPAVANPLLFVYAHAGAPAWFSEEEVLAVLQRATTEWSRCGIPGSVVRAPVVPQSGPGTVQVLWTDALVVGNFAQANISQRKLELGPKSFAFLKTRNPAYDARQTLQMVISHEMGHLYGLVAHSRRCVDVTSYYDNGKGETCYARDITQLHKYPEYRSPLPTACDIARCRIANGLAPILTR